MSSYLHSVMARVQTQAAETATIYTILVRKFYLLWDMAEPSTLHELYKNSYGAHGFNLILSSLVSEYVKDVCNIVFDKSKHSPSIVAIMNKIDIHPELIDLFCKSFCAPLPINWIADPQLKGDELARIEQQRIDSHAKRKQKEFDDCLTVLYRLYLQILNNATMHTYQSIRNKVCSHYDISWEAEERRVKNITDFGLKWDQLKTPITLLGSLVDAINIVVSGTSYDIGGTIEQSKRISKDFWDKLITTCQ